MGFFIHIKMSNISKKGEHWVDRSNGACCLPPRLKPELVEVEHFLLGEENQMAEYHRPWAEQLKKNILI